MLERRWIALAAPLCCVQVVVADPGNCMPGSGCKDEANWLDRSHSALSERTAQLASSLDRFFGVEDSVAEAARSFLRVRVSSGYDHLDGGDGKVSIKGQWHLPRVDERLGLVFADGDEPDDLEANAEESGRSLGLRFEQSERKRRGRFGFRATFRSGGKLKTELRYRYEFEPFENAVRTRSTSAVWWQDGRGVGVTLGGAVEKSLSSRQLLRYSALFERAEDFEGTRWHQSVALNARLSLRDASVFFLRFNGETQPNFLQSVAFGVLYRRQTFRQWMYTEIEPVFDWRRVNYEDKRAFSPSLTLRLEWQLGEPVQLWKG